MYKINLHTHSIFSDGTGCPYQFAKKAKKLNFSSLVITDHFYGLDCEISMNKHKITALKNSLIEARKILPIIIGLEVSVEEEEVLIFGQQGVNHIINTGQNDIQTLEWLKNEGCVFILCHPRHSDTSFIPDRIINLIDGFEAYNNSDYLFENKDFGKLGHLPKWSNSDAHRVCDLFWNHNETKVKIDSEEKLIKYIKSREQPDLYLMEELQK